LVFKLCVRKNEFSYFSWGFILMTLCGCISLFRVGWTSKFI
jgi:hypothetical protein